MSLVGSLEDLGLGDILQIISLSRKSGVLMLRSEQGEGQILFREGRVTGALCKGEPADLRSLLLARGAVSEAELAEAARTSQESGRPLVEVLRELPALEGDALDELRRRHAERAVLALFAWPSGEFSFDVRDDLDAVDPDLCVEAGIDAQYLAMEGARIRDEDQRDEDLSADAGDPMGFAELGRELRDEDAAEAVGAADGDSETSPDAAQVADAAGTTGTAAGRGLARLDEGEGLREGHEIEEVEAEILDAEASDAEIADEDLEAGVLVDEDAPPDAPEVAGAPASEPPAADVPASAVPAVAEPPSAESRSAEERFATAAGSPSAEPAPAAPRSTVPVIAVDPDLALLEWAKAALRRSHERVHIFQKTELAFARIRQYLVRREVPVVVITDATPPDPNSGATAPAEIVRRLKALLPRMPVVGLAAEPDAARAWGVDVVAAKPTPSDLHNPRRAPAAREMGEALGRATSEGPPAHTSRRRDPHALRRLREVSAELREAVPRGRIIPVVLGFAAEHFARVALFLVRDSLAVGMAGAGLERAGGPDDVALRELSIRADEPAWFRAVFESGAPVRGPARDPGDRKLVALLGEGEPAEAYVAPLESGERVIAVLYADNLPGGEPLPDTHALEVVLHEAGLALDRAALERQLAQMETDSETRPENDSDDDAETETEAGSA